MRKALHFIFEIGKTVLIALLIVLPIRYFIFQPFYVKGASMEPNFHDQDYLIVDELTYRFRSPERGEVVVFKYPNNPKYYHIKRIIGLPGEEIEIKEDKIIVHNATETVLEESAYMPFSEANGQDLKIKLNEKEYFVLGDNRAFSVDSRMWGVLPYKNIVGKVFIRLWPFNNFNKIKAPAY